MEDNENPGVNKISRLQARRLRTVRERRGAFILPSLLTTANIFCGFAAIICVLNSFANPLMKPTYYEVASILILVSILLDALDGRVARMTNTASQFGLQYDSLADIVSFGVAPGLLAYGFALTPFGRFGWLATFLFLICGAMRLARFNITVTSIDKKYSMGLPIPVAAAMIASLVLIDPTPVKEKTLYAFGIIGYVYLLSYFMVSKIRYRTFKELDLKARRPTRVVVILAIMFLVFATHRSTLFITGSMYVLSGPILKLVNRLKTYRSDSHQQMETEEDKSA